MVFRLADIASSLGTRQLGAQIREEIECQLSNGGIVSIDFSDMNVISNSFADECFGRLLQKHDISVIKSQISFKNANPFIASVLLNSLRQRMSATA